MLTRQKTFRPPQTQTRVEVDSGLRSNSGAAAQLVSDSSESESEIGEKHSNDENNEEGKVETGHG